MKVALRISPSHRSMMYLVNEKNQIMIMDITNIDRSVSVMPCNCMGQISPVTPNMPRILNTLDPSTLPMAIPLLPFRAETILVASSGSDVPPATMVSPTTASCQNPYNRHGRTHFGNTL